MSVFQIEKNGFTFDGKPFYLASGDMQYFRYFRKGWRRRLQLMKDFGLTALQTYVPWNLHEPEKGEFHFEDNLDLAAFLQECQEVGLKVMLRPSVYMCGEWDFGGLPYWLLKENIPLRCSDPRFMKHVREYTKRLSREFVPHLCTNGGPIIAVAVENEYGSYGTDHEYLRQTRALFEECGVDVPFFSANGSDAFKVTNGNIPGVWAGCDFGGDCTPEQQRMLEYQPDKPVYCAEFWPGMGQQWGGFFNRRQPEVVAQNYEKALNKGLYVNFYMFAGGTNFGFMGGGLYGRFRADKANAPLRYIPYSTSYDVDALISEGGVPTPKYYACREALQQYLGIQTPAPDNHVPSQCISIDTPMETADLLEQAECIASNIKDTATPWTMEEMDQDYGFILYTTHIRYTDDRERILHIDGLHDRATVYADEKYIGTMMRDRESEPIRFRVPKEGLTLRILVENMGRVCYGYKMQQDRKGITGAVRVDIVNENGSLLWNLAVIHNWRNTSLRLADLSGLQFDSKPVKNGRPTFYRTKFKAVPGVDTYLDMSRWGKGCVWINGFNLGRYWQIGPQQTLYVPGELLQEDNELIVLELHPNAETPTLCGLDSPILDSIPKESGLIEAARD